MGVLALYVRTDACLAVLVVLQAAAAGVLDEAEVGVHRACDAAPLAVALVVGEACRVESADAVHDRGEIVAASALVTGAPDDDSGVVAQGEHLTHGALYHGGLESLLVGKAGVAVTFHVGLGQDIQTEAVAEVVEIGVVGVVAGADAVDVEALHLQHVGLDLRLREGATAVLAETVAVYAMEDDAVAVDQQGTVGTDADRAQSHFQRADVGRLAFLREGQTKVVEARLLGAPSGDAFD